MVGRRDQGGMTIWWSSSTCTHPSLPLTPSHFYMPASLALIWAPTPLADSFRPGIAALGDPARAWRAEALGAVSADKFPYPGSPEESQPTLR